MQCCVGQCTRRCLQYRLKDCPRFHKVYNDRIGPIIESLKSRINGGVHFSGVSTKQGSTVVVFAVLGLLSITH